MRIVIIGGVAAGTSAAAKARRIDKEAEITIYTEENAISYGGCSMPYYIQDMIKKPEMMIARTPEKFREQGINIELQHRAIQILSQEKKVVLRDLVGQKEKIVDYDKLLIATGASPIKPVLDGSEAEGNFVLRKLDDAIALKQFLIQHKPKRAVIVGGGNIGLEMAEAFFNWNIDITVLEAAIQLAPSMDLDMAEIVEKRMREHGIEVRKNERLQKINTFEGRVKTVITDRGEIECDIVLWAIGTQPNSEIAEKAGLLLGPKKAILVNEKQETSVADIYAAGDCCTVNHLLTDSQVYLPLGTTANKQGRTAGENMVGGNTSFKGVVGSGIFKTFGLEVARSGLSERELKNLVIDYYSKKIVASNHPRYYPGAQDMTIKILAEKGTKKLLGAQIVGGKEAGKRIDVFATALHGQMTIDDMAGLDLSYSPPFSPVWDAVLIAVNAAK